MCKQIAHANSTVVFVLDSSWSPLADLQGWSLLSTNSSCRGSTLFRFLAHRNIQEKKFVKGEVKHKHFDSCLTEASVN